MNSVTDTFSWRVQSKTKYESQILSLTIIQLVKYACDLMAVSNEYTQDVNALQRFQQY